MDQGRRFGGRLALGAALVLGALAVPLRTTSAANRVQVAGARLVAPSPRIAATPAPVAAPEPVEVAPDPTPVDTAEVPAPCRAVVLVHGGGYFFGDAGSLEVAWAEPMRRAGLQVWNVDYPMLPDMPDVRYDETDPWYPRPDVDSTPAALRVVHERATAAVAPAVAEAQASGCRVTLLGISAGGSIVADLAHRFPDVHEAVLVAGATITPDRLGGAPLRIFYGAADDVVLPAASTQTCARWIAAGSACAERGFEGEGHVSVAVSAAALAHVLADG